MLGALPLLARLLPVIKALGLGAVTLWVIGQHRLTPLERALIVAGVSGALGILAVIVGQLMSRAHSDAMARIVLESAQANHALLQRLEALQHEQTGKLDTIQEQTNGGEH